MKNTRNEVKIKFGEPKYHIDEYNKVIVCRLPAQAMIPHNLKQVMWDVNDVWPIDLEEFETKGIARLSPNDTWDENNGMKVALAKAENKAYLKVGTACQLTISHLLKQVKTSENFLYKASNVMEHNVEYIDKF